jgi:thiamine-phosphate pyrophosphorylase
VRARIRGLYGIADAGVGGDPERLAAELIEGGCRLVQLRCKGWEVDDVQVAARAILARCRTAGATFIVNDHAGIAAAVGADGVHVGQLDAAPDAVRTIVGPDRIIGRSTNDAGQLVLAIQGADYVAFGPVFPTANAGRPKTVRGLEALAAMRRLTDAPLVAIGGITVDTVGQVRAAGADAWAVIGAIAGQPDRVAATRAFLTALPQDRA